MTGRAQALRALVQLMGVVALAAAGVGCAAKTGVAPQCQRDSDCGSGVACTGGSCIPRVNPPGSWGVELEPRTDSMAALTEFNAVVFGNGPLELMAEPKVAVTGTFSSGPSTPSLAHVIVTVPAAIPGRPDLEFEADLAPATTIDPGGGPQFVLAVPQGTLGRKAMIQLIPSPPADQQHPPVTFERTLATTLPLSVPAQTYNVTGRFFDAIGDPRQGFVARAFRDGQLASNVDLTDNAGAFTLSIPVATVQSDPQRPFTVELKPQDPTSTDPRYSSRLFTLGSSIDLGTLNLATFSRPNVFRFAVRGGADDGPAVSGAIVRAHTVLSQDTSTGSTEFLRDAHTDSEGAADLALLPGTVATSRPYAIVVIPPADSPYGVVCLSKFPIAAGGTADAPASVPAIVLPFRPALTGQVLAADGTPVSGVTVVATRNTGGSGDECGDSAGSPPTTTNTKDDGTFTLLVDPGTYQVEYDPPAGSPVPRLSEVNVSITQDSTREVRMPPGALVEGDATGPDGAPLPLAGLRLYEVQCGGARGACTGAARVEPLLRGQTRADANGHFRAVIPVP